MLEEEPLNMKLDKNYVETYYYEKKAEIKNDKLIDLKDYLLSNSVSTNNIYREIQNNIFEKSESIYEPPKRNYSLDYKELESKKLLHFERKKINWDESIKGLNDLLLEISQLIRELQSNNEINEIPKFIDLYNSTKLTLATTYLYNKKWEIGKKLIDELISDHPKYLRPYIKKFEFFHTRGEMENAKEFYELIKKRRNELTNEKDRDYFDRVSKAFMKDWEPYEKVNNFK